MNNDKNKATAVVFAYHNVGVRCLKVLLEQGVQVQLVLTHQDNPTETIWFESVVKLCQSHGIAYETPESVSGAPWVARLQEIAPDFIFSFYYRNMLPMALLATAKQGAFNMHGSLLPKYRGRVPVNWAIVKGETQTGATLHYMVEKPDAGEIVAQRAVPILADDTAKQVFDKVCVAAECALYEVLPDVITGTAQRLANDLSKGSYFGGRKPEDGRIDLAASSSDIYNLIRAVAPPYPGAYLQAGTETLWVDGAERVHSSEDESTLLRLASKTPGSLVRWQGQSYLRGATGGWLKLHLRSA